MGRRFDTEKRAIAMGTKKVWVVVELYYNTVTGASVFTDKEKADKYAKDMTQQCIDSGTSNVRHFVKESLLV
jgi:hypothetical protein